MAYTTIKKPSDYFNTKLYSGTGSSQAVTGVGFQPDWIWFKSRTSTENHNLFDAIRGSNKIIQSSTSNAEATSTALLTSFDSDGFTVNTDGGTNGSGQTYASWNWKANGAGSANTDGSISSTVSVNTTSGFSIVKFTGTGANATVGHGLGVAPSVVITKNLDASANWIYGGDNIGWTKYLIPNLTNAVATANNAWNDTAPNSTVVSLGSSTVTNASANMIAYCFAEKKGYSKFGSYIGNGSTDGTFVYTGFKPAFVLIRNIENSSDDWQIFDNKRANTFNPADKMLQANLTSVEGTSAIDLLSNGFKIRASSGFMNRSGETMIYMAFAEQPLIGDNPATAR